MQNPTLTILTPTYNRKHLLGRLHASLVAQDVPADSFEWLVVDDGSTDGTAAYIRGLCVASDFKIIVHEKQNGGKHSAVNLGIKNTASEWVLVVDSDDWLLPDGIACALAGIDSVVHLQDISALIAPRKIDDRVPVHYSVTSKTNNFAEWRKNEVSVDTSIIVKTELMRLFPFPEFPGERFIPESAVYARCFATGGIMLSNDTVVGAEYQLEGLSAQSLILRIQNPHGTLFTYLAELASGISGRVRARSLINLHRFYLHARLSGIKNVPDLKVIPVWALLALPIYVKDRFRLWTAGK